jgi:cytochrome c554/c'-like protein
MKTRKYLRLGIAFLLPLTFVFSQCFNKSKPVDPRGPMYAGSASCIKCHKNLFRDYMHNVHYLTSREASQTTIHGSFNTDSNTVILNDSTKVIMEKEANGMYQAAYTNGKLTQKQRFDVVFGSKKGETYLYWKGKEVYQLPITWYLNIHKWANSPRYSNDSADFSRIIGRRCFECHASYIQNISHQTSLMAKADSVDKTSMLLSVDCERCHGPGAAHVNFHTQNPEEKRAMYITKISTLSRQQRMDLCSVCHSGNKSTFIRSTFNFKPGDTLDNFKAYEYPHATHDLIKIDVHGDQADLLKSSQCFIKSKLECASCHNIHDNTTRSIKVYSAICTGCHKEETHNFCKMAGKIGQTINNNCIDCHMPVKSSDVIVIRGAGKQASPIFEARIHRIAVYPGETEKVMKWMRKGELVN